MTKLEIIKKNVDTKRDMLYELITKNKDMLNFQVLAASKDLDELINEYYMQSKRI